MKIAVDLSTLQTGHRMRGIGAVLINFINHLPNDAREKHEFVFFINPGKDSAVLELLQLDNTRYTIEYLHPARRLGLRLPYKFHLIVKTLNKIMNYLEFHTGDSRIHTNQLQGIDRFLQFDQNQKLPKYSKRLAVVILYDIIPYVMESDYLWSYATARRNDRSRRSALKSAFKRYQYIAKLKITCNRARRLIAISEHTKNDFVKYVGVKSGKIAVSLLGADYTPGHTTFQEQDKYFSAFKITSWGSVRHTVDLSEKPFILFMGGADPRRKLVELMAAYNNLRARGVDIVLIFAGDTMYGADKVPHEKLQTYLKTNSSYLDDVHFVGFVTDRQKEWLYQNALTYIYPSAYEGFGLPVLEAMLHGTPVITYKNSSIYEIAGDAAIYASGFKEIADSCISLLNDQGLKMNLRKLSLKQSNKFKWETTSSNIVAEAISRRKEEI